MNKNPAEEMAFDEEALEEAAAAAARAYCFPTLINWETKSTIFKEKFRAIAQSAIRAYAGKLGPSEDNEALYVKTWGLP